MSLCASLRDNKKLNSASSISTKDRIIKRRFQQLGITPTNNNNVCVFSKYTSYLIRNEIELRVQYGASEGFVLHANTSSAVIQPNIIISLELNDSLYFNLVYS